MMSRAEHSRWAKQRALELLDLGEPNQAYTSMISDLGKHAETQKWTPEAIETGMIAVLAGPDIVRAWIMSFSE